MREVRQLLYFTRMLAGLFIRKANFKRITSILRKENFDFTAEDVNALLKGNQKGMRYGNAVLIRHETGKDERRFIKIVLDGTWRTYQAFRRQVRITEALSNDQNFAHPTMRVLSSSLIPPLPYAVFETREQGEDFGFMHDDRGFYERFTSSDMRRLIELMYAFHQAGSSLQSATRALTRRISSTVNTYEREFKKLLNTRITHVRKDGTRMTDSVCQLLVSYTGVQDIGAIIVRKLERYFALVASSKTKAECFLVHADMQIDNVYKHENGDFELLDFEWVGRCSSPAIAIMFDYGNLRARAWSSPRFQAMLDASMLEVGAAVYPNSVEMIKAALALGILRSSLLMSRFHLDYINTVSKDRHTVEEYEEMYPRTINSLMGVIR